MEFQPGYVDAICVNLLPELPTLRVLLEKKLRQSLRKKFPSWIWQVMAFPLNVKVVTSSWLADAYSASLKKRQPGLSPRETSDTKHYKQKHTWGTSVMDMAVLISLRANVLAHCRNVLFNQLERCG